MEAYPQLQSQQHFPDDGTARRHRKLDPVSRHDYNEAVQAYNTRIRTFPDAIGAKIFYGAKPKVPFEAAAGPKNAPKVDFNASCERNDPEPVQRPTMIGQSLRSWPIRSAGHAARRLPCSSPPLRRRTFRR